MSRIAVLRVEVAEEQDCVGGGEIASAFLDIEDVQGVKGRRRQLFADDEVKQQLVVLRGMHVDRNQDAAVDLAAFEKSAEVSCDADEEVEVLSCDLLGRRCVDIGDVPLAREDLVQRPGDDVGRRSPKDVVLARQGRVEMIRAVT